MNYRHVYMLIIEHAKSEEKLGLRKKGNGTYYERHHILPKSLFPLWVKRGSNLVLLTAREHFFCHQLLTKIYPGSKMALALYGMAHTRSYKLSDKEYSSLREECLREELFSSTKGKKWFTNGDVSVMSLEKPDGFVPGRKPMTEDQRTHYRKVKKAAIDSWTVEQKDHYRKLQQRRWENLTEEEHKKWIESHDFVASGKASAESRKKWSKEKMSAVRQKAVQTMKNNGYAFASTKGLHCYNNGVRCIYAKECPEGFVKGRLPISEETRKKMREAQRNITEEKRKEIRKKYESTVLKRTEEQKRAIREKYKNTIKNRTEEQKQEISKHIRDAHKRKLESMTAEERKKSYGVNLGRRYWTNGAQNKLQKECPGEGWYLGLTKRRQKPNG